MRERYESFSAMPTESAFMGHRVTRNAGIAGASKEAEVSAPQLNLALSEFQPKHQCFS